MSDKFIRVYQKLDIQDIQKHLLIYGDLSASCANCQAIDIKLDASQCPQCQAEFKYISFRNIKSHLPKIQKLTEERPELRIVDFDDYKRILGVFKAKEFLQ